VSGKSNLTFEEALVSEHNAIEKAQKLPTELMAHILQMTQYSKILNTIVCVINRFFILNKNKLYC
jgi:hypothetical protein